MTKPKLVQFITTDRKGLTPHVGLVDSSGNCTCLCCGGVFTEDERVYSEKEVAETDGWYVKAELCWLSREEEEYMFDC